MAQRVRDFGTTVFVEMTMLANQHQAVNLGQGAPDFAAPDFIKEAARKAIADDINQYAPGIGRPRLRHAIADKMERQYGYRPDPDTGVVVTNGATEAIFAAISGLVDPGDEVVLFEPYYDSYVPAILMAGGIPRFYTLRSPDWTVDAGQLAALFSEKTKLVLLNTPHNPTGKVFSLEELELTASLCRKYDAVAVTDEVYEHILFDGARHHLMASLPGMAQRTLCISSMGKTFSVTGWKVGWAVGPAPLVNAVFRAHQFMTFCGAAPLQEAAATAMAAGDDYYTQLVADYLERRDFLVDILGEAGFKPVVPKGTYFVIGDVGGHGFADDVDFCRRLPVEVGVAAIPCSAFYHDPADGKNLVRFAFCKSRPALEEAAKRLKKMKKGRR